MADKKYRKIEPKDPDAGLKSLGEVVTAAINNLPTADTSDVADKLQSVANAVEELSNQQRASQEASQAFYKEAIASLGEIAKIKLEAIQGASEGVDVQALLEGMAKLIPEPAPMPAPVEPVDIEGIIRQVFELTKKQPPKYTFNIERNHSGVLVGITATPEEGR